MVDRPDAARCRASACGSTWRSRGPTSRPETSRLPARPFLTRHRWAPWVAGAIVAAAIDLVVGLRLSYALMFGVIVGLLVHEVEAYLAIAQEPPDRAAAGRRDRPDGGIAPGRGGRDERLEAAIDESRAPLRPQLEEVLGRIRYGDDPRRSTAA